MPKIVRLFVMVFSLVVLPVAGHARERVKPIAVKNTWPAEGATAVRPDTTVKFYLDTQQKGFREHREQLEKGRFAVVLKGGGEESLFLGPGHDDDGDLRANIAGISVYDAGSATVTIKPGLLQRYTTYTATLVVKDAYEAVIHERDEKGRDEYNQAKHSFSFSFTTGSDIGEPTRLLVSATNRKPRVTEGGQVQVRITDDYDSQATMGKVMVTGAATDGSALPPSFSIVPQKVQLSPSQPGDLLVNVTDRKAQKVEITVETSGPWPEDKHVESIELLFQPGPPASIDLAVPRQLTVGESVYLEGEVADAYWNAVLDGTGVSLAASAGSIHSALTEGGRFRSAFDAPKTLKSTPGQGEQVSITARAGQVSIGGTVQVVPGAPANIVLAASAAEAPADGESTVSLGGEVTDGYGNAVLDGTPVKLLLIGEGRLSTSSTATLGGKFSFEYHAGTSVGRATITARVGAADASLDLALVPPEATGSQPALLLAMNPRILAADGTSTAVVSGRLVDGDNPLAGAVVLLSATGGTIEPQVTTGPDGTFEAVFTAGDRQGEYTVTASYGNLRQELSLGLREVLNFTGRSGYISSRSVFQVNIPRDQVIVADYRLTGGSNSRWAGIYVYPEGTNITFYGYDHAYGWRESYYNAVKPAAVLQGYGVHRLYLPAGKYLFIPSSDAYVYADYEMKLEFSASVASEGGPPPVSNLTGRAASNLVNRLAWEQHPDFGPHAYYRVYRSDLGNTGMAGSVPHADGVLVSEFADAGVFPGKTYYYAVSFVDEAGRESPLSGAVRVDVPTTYRVEDGNQFYLTYRNGPNGWFGVWGTVSDSRYSEGSAHAASRGYYNNYVGVEAEVAFCGTGLNLITGRTSAEVSLDVYLDGQYLKRVTIPPGPVEYQLAVPLVAGQAYGDHRLRLVLVSNTPFVLDAVEIATR